MADKSDADKLAGMFSSRKRAETKQKLIEGSSSDNSQMPATKEGSSSGQQTASRPRKPSTSTTQMNRGMSSLAISPIANALLRETRRELSNRHDSVKAGDDIDETDIAKAIDRVCATKGYAVDDIVRADIIVHLKRDLLGWGVLQPLIDNPEVTDIHCYDYKTVVLQRGKISETTGLHWPNKESYVAFIDRLLFRLGKSLSTQQHTVDASFPDGKRICAVHESVCGSRGPLVTIRVPRVPDINLETLLIYQVAPPLIVNYLAALVRASEFTMMVAGETGTGKTTLIRCLGTQFRADESIIGVEDTPELNFQHPYYRSLVSRTANTEGVGEVSLQEHIKTTLRLCPSRVILGEMRTPEAAEAFLESAQTGHVGMSTIHARNARETLTRLESLLGRAQRGVMMEVIRQQIGLALDVVVWMLREKVTGRVRLGEVIEVGNFVEGVIQVRPMFRLAEQGDNPVWEVQSWGSNFEHVLDKNGIILGDAPKYLSFSR